MSYYDIDNAHPQDLIVSYILSLKGKGCFLPYTDYEIISLWLERAQGDVDAILMILSEILPNFFSNAEKKDVRHPSMSAVSKTVLRRLEDQAQRKADPCKIN